MTQTGWFGSIVKGGQQKVQSPRLFIYGVAGIGKSTFGASLPAPLFIDFDRGIDEIKVDRIPGPRAWKDTLTLLRGIAAEPHGYKSIVIDTVDPLEELAIEHVSAEAGKSFDKMNDDFGAGHVAVGMAWKLFLAELDACRAAGLIVCLIGHAIVRQASDPTIGNFDQFTSALSKRPWNLSARWSDMIGFANFDSALVDKKDEQRVIVTGKRVLYTVRSGGLEAKNRYSLDPKIPLSWEAVSAGIDRHRQTAEAVEAKITALAAKVGGEAPEKARKYVADAKKDLGELLEIEKALQAKLQAKLDVPTAVAVMPPQPSLPAIVMPYYDRISTLANQIGGEAPVKARGYIEEAKGDLVKLQRIVEALEAKLGNGKQEAHV